MPSAQQIVQKYFALHLRGMRSTAAKKLTRMRANFVRARHLQWNTAVARSPYSIALFVMLAR
jgi:hypothetical protein